MNHVIFTYSEKLLSNEKIIAAPDVTKYSNAFTTIGDTVESIAKSMIENAILPIAIIFCLVILAIQIGMIVYLHRDGRGSEIHGKVAPLVITIIVLALLGTFTVWGFTLM